MSARHRAAALVALLVLAVPAAAPGAPFAYVPNEGSATISVIDTATDLVNVIDTRSREAIARIKAGKPTVWCVTDATARCGDCDVAVRPRGDTHLTPSHDAGLVPVALPTAVNLGGHDAYRGACVASA